MSFDRIGESSGASDIDRTLDFETAKTAVAGILSWLLRRDIAAMAKRGVAPADTFPYCLDVITARFHLVAKITATTPSQGAPTSTRL